MTMRPLLKALKNNLHMLYHKERFLLFMMIICSFCSGIMLPFIYGIYCNYAEKLNAQLYELTLLQLRFVEGKEEARVRKEILNDFFQSLPEKVTDQIDMFFVRCRDENGKIVECRFTLEGKEYRACRVLRDNLLQSNILDGYFTDDEEADGKKVAIISRVDGSPGDEISIFGDSYRVVATHDWGNDLIMVPFLSLKEDVELDDYGVVMAFHKRITPEQFVLVKDTVDVVMKDMVYLPEMPKLDQYQRRLYQSLIALMILTGIAISLNYVITYQYIAGKRKRELAVFMICGMNQNKAVLLLMMESAVLLLPGIITGLGVFHFIIRPALYRWMPYLADGYGLKIYLMIVFIFGVTFEVFFGILQKHMMKKQDISSMLRKKR